MTEREITKPSAAISLTAARLSIAAVVTYQVMLIALIFIRPDLDPSWHTISEWAIGRHGWIMVLAFLISAVSYGSLFVAIKSQTRGIRGKIGLGILLICAIGTVGVGVFRTDPMPLTAQKTLSPTGMLHLISGSSALMLLPFAALLINLNLARKNQAWATARRVLLWTGGLPLLGLIGFLVHLAIFVIPLGEDAYGPGVPLGWPPRFLFLTYMVWLITLALQAIKLRSQKT
ncbi:MAG: DUF998 domain-containing protein [Acidobacteria bacterium]|nr:DUF998 domain-containing protein [Acidobacteriota bacterium]